MKLQVIATNTFPQVGTNYRNSLSGKSTQKKTPVRVTLGDPKRDCQGFGLCRLDLGETTVNHACPNARIEFGLLISEHRSDTCWLVLSRQSWERNSINELPLSQPSTTNHLKISASLARLIGLQGNRLQVELPDMCLDQLLN